MLKIVNLTPHEINIVVEGGQTINIPPSGQIARVQEKIEILEYILSPEGRIPVIRKTFGELEGLPELQIKTFYVVSLLVAQAAHRPDVLTIGETIRNEKGQVVGAKSLAVV